MNFTPVKLNGSYLISTQPFEDNRGWFARTWCSNEFASIGHDAEWKQMNHSFTVKKGTIRGMHYQLPPFEEIKMVRCIAGSVFDVIIDIRKDSPTYLQWFGAELSAANKLSLYIPAGFAHGFQTLGDDCELIYMHSAFYTPGSEAGIRYDDPAVQVNWPLPVTEISERDKNLPLIDSTFKAI